MNKWLVLLLLYLTQGLPHGFFGQALPTLLRQQGASLELIGLMSLISLPWVLKFFWAPFLDHYQPLARITGGRITGHIRKTWIISANACAALALIAISFVPLSTWLDQWVFPLALSLIVLMMFVVTQDIATDALAVENIKPAERGMGNSLQVAGYRVGMVIGGGVLIGVFATLQWQGTLLVLAGLMLVGLIPLWFWQPAKVEVDKEAVFKHWLGFFKTKGALFWLFLLFSYKVGDAFGSAMLRPHLVDIGVSLEEFAQLLGYWGTVAGLIGAVLGGVMIKFLSRFSALLLFLVFEAAAIAGYGLIEKLDWDLIYTLVAIEHVTGGMATVALFTVMMDRCREASAGSDYALQSCLVVMATLIATSTAGFSAAALGYSNHYWLAAIICLLGAVIVMMNRQNILVSLKPAQR